MRVKALQINFARRTLNSAVAGTPFWLLALALLGLALFAWALFTASTVAQQVTALDEIAQHTKRNIHTVPATAAPAFFIPEARALMINNAIVQLNIPWSDVFDAIETATPNSIALISLEPDVKKQLLKGSAEALNSDAMIAYIELLKKQPLFVSVILLKHEVGVQDPYKPLRFEFEAQWQGAAP